MQNEKKVLITTLISLFFFSNFIYSQSKSKEDLGNLLVESIVSNDINSFKSALLPKKVVLEFQENNTPENKGKEERDSLMIQQEVAYDQLVMPQLEQNFLDLVKLNETYEIDWNQLKFVLLYKGSSKDEQYVPFFIHSKLNNSDFNHFYFGAVRYKGAWYLTGDMEITKDEKYAPYD
ncbi:hypothetical protein [Namhaeicola litoreus]|uniref:Uncharacterized protein n=1 Tax=Namhaeicola litoreus TaxID=1052145 RepID=A0ABW3XZ91_9FLAO